jgi:hypothetical protein
MKNVEDPEDRAPPTIFSSSFVGLKPVASRKAWLWRATVCLLGALMVAVMSRKTIFAVTIVRRSASMPPDPGPRILFVIRTCPKYYSTRLRDVLETHVRLVPAKLILAVGNTPFALAVHGSPGTARIIDVMPTDGSNSDGIGVCEDNHGTGITCIEGRALYYAYERRADFDWTFVIDDDVYVHHRNLQDTIPTLNENDRHVYTIGGCAPKATCANKAGGGICGGGGWLLSRKNLVRVIEHEGGNGSSYTNSSVRLERIERGKQTDLAAWMAAWMDTGAGVAKEDGSWWSDITAGCVLHERGGIAVKHLPGLHPWTIQRKSLHLEITAQSPAPISYHYVGRDEMPGMRELHDIVIQSNNPSEQSRQDSSV